MSKEDRTIEELKTMNYFDLIAPIVQATQELSEKVVNLEKENKLLLNILQDQTNQLAELRAVVFPPNAS